MERVCYWLAEDGTRFDDANDCEQYETDIKLHEYNIKCWKGSLSTPLTPTAPCDDEMMYISIPTQEGVKWWKDCQHYFGLNPTGIETPGIYGWVDEMGWMRVQDQLARLQSIVEQLEEASK